ncbi:pyruvate kinase [Aquipuribacter sp. MA13-6]|uniref:pyruvate kinase n=1 Tax=unclassified Aquipuribacter TaxID=2635084 RepID=UPI003EEC9C74
MPQTLDDLITSLDLLLEEMAGAERSQAEAIAAVCDEHRAGAVNLVRYAALRQHDRRALQNDLMDIGVTSLATAEADVLAKVGAARDVLCALRGDPGPWDLEATNTALDRGDDLLDTNTEAVFGPTRPGRPTRIMVTFPSEAADDPTLVDSFVAAGMDVARINCAHDGPDAWTRMAEHVRRAAAAAGREVLVEMDLPGPKLRTGPISAGPPRGRARVTRDDEGSTVTPARLWLTPHGRPSPAPVQDPPGTRAVLPVGVDGPWLSARSTGDVISLRDTRGRDRTFTVTHAGPEGVLAEGPRSAYLTDGTILRCDGDRTTASGLTPVLRRLSLAAGDTLVLTTDLTPVDLPAAGEVARIGCTLPQAVAAMAPGDAVLLDDGAVAATVESVAPAEATLRVDRTKPGGQRLGAQKGINLPDTVLDLPALTAEDEAQLPFVAAHADLVAVSFVRTGGDVQHVLDRLAAADAQHLGLVLKIETRQGFENLPEILLVAMRHPRVAVMIARGDLAVEIGYERMSEVPRQILALCEAAHLPCIWATQVLDTLARTGQPTRAEITDAAAGQRAECVMLNKGPHVTLAIATLADILARMGVVQRKSRTLMRHIHSWDGTS